jgi:glycine hydroxymethyltransferase
MALLTPGDTFMGMDLACRRPPDPRLARQPVGQVVQACDLQASGRTDLLIDYDHVAEIAEKEKPKLIIAGRQRLQPGISTSSASARSPTASAPYLMVDMAHYAGLIAGGVYPDPLPHAHVVTTTTHKTLRGPRGGMMLSNDIELGKKINSAVFPGLQGGPLEHVIAAKAVAFGEALKPEFKLYAQQVVDNARALAARPRRASARPSFRAAPTAIVMLVDLRPKGVTGKATEAALEHALHMTCNKNGVPFDTAPFTVTSGVRLGTPGRHNPRLRRWRVPVRSATGSAMSSTAWPPTAPKAMRRSRRRFASRSWR